MGGNDVGSPKRREFGAKFSSLDFHVGIWSGYSITILSFLVRVAFPNIGAQTSPLGSAGLPLRNIALGQPSFWGVFLVGKGEKPKFHWTHFVCYYTVIS